MWLRASHACTTSNLPSSTVTLKSLHPYPRRNLVLTSQVENVLIASSRCYKLCDFGSAAQPRAPGQTAAECRAIEEDIQKHTTLQYRSPEMVDVYRRLPIDEKCDVWALGVLLYKLCYYTTPFEDKGNLAILNASFLFPAFPSYSMKIKNLIGIVCFMRHADASLDFTGESTGST
jgi:serine/threonine protein kinase